MSEKQEKTVEKKITCQRCQHRMSGADAKADNKEGWCPKTRRFVPRKGATCDSLTYK